MVCFFLSDVLTGVMSIVDMRPCCAQVASATTSNGALGNSLMCLKSANL